MYCFLYFHHYLHLCWWEFIVRLSVCGVAAEQRWGIGRPIGLLPFAHNNHHHHHQHHLHHHHHQHHHPQSHPNHHHHHYHWYHCEINDDYNHE